MIPIEVYCRYCGEFVTTKMGDANSLPDFTGEHQVRDECIERLRERIDFLERLLDTFE